METNVVQLLKDLRAYALAKGLEAAIWYHEEESSLMRFANSAISLNTNEHLVRLEITVFDGKKRATYSMIVDPEQVGLMKKGIDIAAEMVQHAQPLSYVPTVPVYQTEVLDLRAYDPNLAALTNEDRLAYFNTVAQGLESKEIKLSGIFSSGVTTTAQVSTKTEHTQYFASSDADITVVLSNQPLKWEVNAQQSAQSKADLNPQVLKRDLAFLMKHYSEDPALQIPLGEYTVVFGADAVGDVMDIMVQLTTDGGLMKRGYSCLTEEQQGKLVFSSKFSLADDPDCIKTYPFSRDLMGTERKRFPLFDHGVFQGFTWSQDDADEFGEQPTGHTVYHNSLLVDGGAVQVASLEELVAMRRNEDILYIPYLHYMNIVNPTIGMITGSSRFGALLLKADGSVAIPFNVRVTQTFQDLFGENVEWLSSEQVVHNVSNTYGQRNPSAIVVPKFMCVRGIEISHSNSSY
ncbi:MAG: metallopeptidase TldD-related protein [Anaerolineaceae bacterium]